jgi:hypothetical protein
VLTGNSHDRLSGGLPSPLGEYRGKQNAGEKLVLTRRNTDLKLGPAGLIDLRRAAHLGYATRGLRSGRQQAGCDELVQVECRELS